MNLTEYDQRQLEKVLDLESTKQIFREASSRICQHPHSQSPENIQDLLANFDRFPELKELYWWGSDLGLFITLALGVGPLVSSPDPELDGILRSFYEQMKAGIDPATLLSCSTFLSAASRIHEEWVGIGAAASVLNRAAHGMEWQFNVNVHRPEFKSTITSSEDPSIAPWEGIFLVVFAVLWALFLGIGQ